MNEFDLDDRKEIVVHAMTPDICKEALKILAAFGDTINLQQEQYISERKPELEQFEHE